MLNQTNSQHQNSGLYYCKVSTAISRLILIDYSLFSLELTLQIINRSFRYSSYV